MSSNFGSLHRAESLTTAPTEAKQTTSISLIRNKTDPLSTTEEHEISYGLYT